VTIVAIVQARSSSSRLPGKVMLPIMGEPMLSRQVGRIVRAESLDKVVVATSTETGDDTIQNLCNTIGVECFRGSLDDVLGRFDACAALHDADDVVRLTGDCPLTEPGVIDTVVRTHVRNGADYTSNVHPPTWPDGLDVEVVNRDVLSHAAARARLSSEREHVTSYITSRKDVFSMSNVETSPDRSDLRLTVDEPRDFDLVTRIFEALLPADPEFTLEDVLALLDSNPEWMSINAGIARNEGPRPLQGGPGDHPSEQGSEDAS